MLPPQFQEVGVVAFLKENIVAVNSTIINMIERAISDGREISRHDSLPDLSGPFLQGIYFQGFESSYYQTCQVSLSFPLL
jgi:hypothetical protein